MNSRYPPAFGASFALHLLGAAMLTSFSARALQPARPAAVTSRATVTVDRAATHPSRGRPAKPRIGLPQASAAEATQDDWPFPRGQGSAALNLPGFQFDFAKIANRATSLFPFLSLDLALESLAPTARRTGVRLVNPVARPPDYVSKPPLMLADEALQSIVDKAWSRRHRWTPFQPIVTLAHEFNPATGRLPAVIRAYVDQNALQPYADTTIPDPRLWTELGIAADHAEFIDFTTRYAAGHPSTKAATELLFLLDKLAQGSLDALMTLMNIRPSEDLTWTRDANREAHNLIVTLQRYYSRELARYGLTTSEEIRAHYDRIRIRILNGVLNTTHRGYRAGDARFLIGTVFWRAGRTADAVRAWRLMTIDPSDSYVALSSEILSAIRAADGNGQPLDRRRISNIVNAERGTWINFSYTRLRQFGYRFDAF